ncbi:MAG: VWA domain-containing protein, partial [Planctomycetota bacterium]
MNRGMNAALQERRFNKFAFLVCAILPGLIGASSAFATRTVTAISLDGGAPWTFNSSGVLITAGDPVSVGAGDSISVSMTVVTSGSSSADDWESSSWQIATASGTWLCTNSANFTSSGTHTTSFTIIAPATTGVYHSYFRAHDGDTCGGSAISKPVQLVNSVTIEPQEPNPVLDEACGLDIVLVLDVSGSIGGNITQVKDAANAFVNAFLPGTPTLIGLVKFNETAVVLEDLTSDTAALSADIASLASGGWTNWQGAIMAARGLLEGGLDRDDLVHPDMIVVVTDGDPTASTAGGSTSTQPNVHLAPAVIQADLAKTSSSSMPIRMIAVGVGAVTESRLVAISGPNVSPPNPIDSTVDVVLDDFAGLADALNDLALTMCGGTITVHKIIDLDGNIATTGDQTNGAGWTFTTNVDAPDFSTPPSGATDLGGFINFAIDLGVNGTGVVDVLETLQSAFTFISASCKIGLTPVGTPGTNVVNNISIGASDIVTCTFYNRPKLGACCNTNIAGSNCTDSLTQSQCSGAGFIWTPNMLCSAVSCCSAGESCADSDPCTTDMCISGTGCVHTPIVCNDNNPCTTDACVGGSCVYTPVTCADNGNPCTDLACDPNGANGNCNLTVPVNNGAACDDGLYCTVSEVCSNGTCGGGLPRDCGDSVSCTNDSCDEANNVCVHNPVNAKCSDGLYCNGVETCHETLGCQAGTPPCSPDGVACTVDGCDEATDTCTHTPNDAACSDGLYCNGTETCDALLGCQSGSSPCPPDSVSCTVDGCDEATDTCTHIPNDGACNDGLYCNGVETCHPTLGCQAGTSPCPPDSVDCTMDGCDEATDTCTHAPNHAACNDSLYCNGVETCDVLLGCQAGTTPCPPDSVACTVDGCDEATDTCTHAPNNAACSDGLFCNGTETCDPLLGCQPGTPPCSPDGVACTVDGCDEAADVCTHVPTDSLCSDGLYCNGNETCDPLNGCQPGASPCPPDSVNCTVDGCDEGTDS